MHTAAFKNEQILTAGASTAPLGAVATGLAWSLHYKHVLATAALRLPVKERSGHVDGRVQTGATDVVAAP